MRLLGNDSKITKRIPASARIIGIFRTSSMLWRILRRALIAPSSRVSLNLLLICTARASCCARNNHANWAGVGLDPVSDDLAANVQNDGSWSIREMLRKSHTLLSRTSMLFEGSIQFRFTISLTGANA